MLTNSEKKIILKKLKGDKESEIKKWIEMHGIDNKDLFKNTFPETSYKKIKFKWKNVWNPELKKGNWNSEEDLQIFKNFILKNGSWSKISNEIKNRSRIAIRNRFKNSFKSKYLDGKQNLFHSLILQKKVLRTGI